VIIRRSSNNVLSGPQLGILAAGTFTLGVDAFVVAGLLPQIARDLDVTPATAGQLTTAFALTYAIGSPVLAAVTGRWDRRALLALGLATFLVGMVAQAAGPTYGVVLAGRVVAALGAAAFQANAYAVAGLLTPEARRARSLAAVTAGSTLAALLGAPLGVLLGQSVGWRGSLWVVAGLAAVAGACVLLLPSAHVPPTSLRTRLGVLVRPPVLAVLVTTVVVLAPMNVVVAYLPLALADDGGRLVALLVVLGVGQVVGNRLVGRLVDRIGPVRVTLAGVGLTAVCLGLVGPAHGEPVLAGALLLALGLASAQLITPSQFRLFAVAPDAPTVALGLNGSAIYVGMALGAAVGGAVVGAGHTASLGVIGAASAVAAAGVTWAAARVRRPAPAPQPAVP